MAGDSAQTFRTQFNGFNKDDVNGFIESMNVEFTENENNYKKIIVQQKKQLDELNTKLDALTQKAGEVDSLSARAAEAEEKAENITAEFEGKLSTANEELEKLKAEKSKCDDKAASSAAEAKKAADTSKAEIASLQRKLSEAAKSSAELLARAEKAEKQASAASAALSDYEAKDDALSEANAKLQNELSERSEAAINGLKDQIDALNADVEVYKAKESEYGDALAALDDQLKAATAERDEFAVTATERDSQIETLKAKLESVMAERDTVYEELQNKLKNAVSPNETEAASTEATPDSAAKDDSKNEKARLYDKVSRQVGSMLIDAREISDGIISDANAKAEKIVAKAENDAQTIRAEADERRTRSLLYINQTLKRMSSACMSEYLKYINDTRSALDSMLEMSTNAEHAVFARFTSIMESTQRDVDTGLDKINKKSNDQ